MFNLKNSFRKKFAIIRANGETIQRNKVIVKKVQKFTNRKY